MPIEQVTSPFAMNIAITIPTKVLDKNPNRLLWSMQNLGVNWLAFGPSRDLTAGTYGLSEGMHLAAGQPISDNVDKGELWAVADTAAVNISGVEISLIARAGDSRAYMTRRSALRP